MQLHSTGITGSVPDPLSEVQDIPVSTVAAHHHPPDPRYARVDTVVSEGATKP